MYTKIAGLTLTIVCTAALVGCTAQMVTLVSGAQSVRVAKSDPPPGYVLIGPISAVSGHGCGGFGKTGSYVDAVNRLRNEAFLEGADFVEIYTLTAPHPMGLCYDDSYQITGMAYKHP